MSAPALPARKRSDRSRPVAKNGPIKATTAIQELQRTAESTAEMLQQQEPLIRKTMQEEPILQQAMASNPELAQLLQPDTLQQLVSAVKSPNELQQFFESRPQLQDLTKHRQTVMSLRQQLQTLRQQHVRSLVPQTSPENLQAARQILSQFMQVDPNMPVSQLRAQWPGQHPLPPPPYNQPRPGFPPASHSHAPTPPGHPHMPQSQNHYNFPPASYSHSPPPLPPSTHDHTPLSPLLQDDALPASSPPAIHPHTQPAAPPAADGTPATESQNATPLPFTTLQGANTVHPAPATGHTQQPEVTQHQYNTSAHTHHPQAVQSHYNRGGMHPPHSAEEIVPDAASRWQQSPSAAADGHMNNTRKAGGHDRAGVASQPHNQQSSHWHPHQGHAGSHAGVHWHDAHPGNAGGHAGAHWHPHHGHAGSGAGAHWPAAQGHHHIIDGSFDSYSQFFSTAYQLDGSGDGRGKEGPDKVESDARPLDPKYYYEQVQPSDWAPPPAESCVYLYSRAYLGPMEILFPPLWFALSACLCAMKPAPLWALFLVVPFLFVAGMELLVVQGAGVSRKQLAVSKLVPSFVVSCEVAGLVVVAARMMPLMLYGGTWMAVQVVLLTASILAVMLLHWWAATSDPGYIDPVQVDQADGEDTHLKLPLNPAHIMPECWTCRIPRPLRSKHCSVCQRCVSRFDHHCNMLPNCVGAANQTLFASFLFTISFTLVFFLKLSWQYCWLRFAALSEQLHGDNKWPTWLLVLQAAGENAREVVLLQVLYTPIAVGLMVLSARCVLLITGNLTTNELLNRHRYTYLRHEMAGFCNRFDWGPVRNFWQFWGKQKGVDWWKEFEAGDKAMRTNNMTMITTWSATYYIRLWDLKYQQVSERLYKIREERRERRMQSAMMRLHQDMD